MNNKILSVVLVAGIATTGFAWLSSANETWTGVINGNSEIQEIKEKLESGLALTVWEQSTLDEAKANRWEKGSHKGGKRKGGGKLSDEEQALLENMSDEEKQAFFIAKKEEMNAQKEAKADVVTALIAGETLTAEQELIRTEILAQREAATAEGKEVKPGKEVILKLLSGETLTDEDQASLDEMKAKSEEREAQKAILEPIKAKLDAGEELSDEEQAVLDDHKATKSEGKQGGRKGNKMNK